MSQPRLPSRLRLAVAGGCAVLLAWLGYAVFGGFVPPAKPFGAPPPKPGIRSVRDAVQFPVAGLRVYVFATGDIEIPGEAMLDPKHPKVKPEDLAKQFVPGMAYLIRHPLQGDVLVDTGFGPAFVGASNGDLGWYTRPLVKTRVNEGQDLSSQLARLGVSPASLKYVVITHGHVDHTAGLPALGPVTVLVGKGERRAIAAPFALKRGYKQSHFAGVRDLLEVDFDRAPTLGPLGHAVDLFGDASVFLVDARGHTPGHLSVLVNLPEGPLMLTGDTVQTARAFVDGIPSGNVTDARQAREAVDRLLSLRAEFPNLRAFYGHDFNDALRALKPPEFYR